MVVNRPPMGWNSWNTFGPDINEEVVMQTADYIAESGLKDCGYEYVVIDDCWSLRERNEKGEIVPDPEKFPHGMKYVADYVHSKGLKFGMYSCAGTMTCARYPGSLNNEFIDAKCFAEWEIDYLKYDYCFHPRYVAGDVSYKRMAIALANCGRDIVLAACSWGADNTKTWIKETGAHTFRSTGDINDSWASMRDLTRSQLQVLEYNGKGCFNDMDMLIVGMKGKGNVAVSGCTDDEYRTHFAVWAFLGSPLIIGCDLRKIDEENLKTLKNPVLIGINQDGNYSQPFFLTQRRDYRAQRGPDDPLLAHYELDMPVMAKMLDNGDIAIGAFNLTDGRREFGFMLDDLGLYDGCGKTLELTDCWTGETIRPVNNTVCYHLDAHCSVVYRAKVVDL
ncbi:MAG: glycoside hydrolase family 27 protein [Clostridia bacterium]|nr:glycoside hydrolase family 27 protein [Clostridia bacterium]